MNSKLKLTTSPIRAARADALASHPEFHSQLGILVCPEIVGGRGPFSTWTYHEFQQAVNDLVVAGRAKIIPRRMAIWVRDIALGDLE